MALNLEALKKAKTDLDKKNGGSEMFLSSKDLNEEGKLIRLVPPPAVLNGSFYFAVNKIWMTFNGKRTSVICPSTFGKRSPIKEELEAAAASDDPEIVELATDSNSKTGFSFNTEYWFACLELSYELAKDGTIAETNVADGIVKVFQCGKQTLLSAIITCATNPKVLRATGKSEDGITDRKLGFNLMLTKTGEKLNTKYACVVDEQMELPSKFYANIPNVVEIAQVQMPVAKYQRAMIRQVLYGTEIPKEVQALEDERKEKAKAYAKLHTPKPAAAIAEDEDEAPKKRKPAPADEDEDEAPKKVAKKKPAFDEEEEEAPRKPKKRVLEDDDDEEEEAPAPKKKAKAPVDDEDEDDAPAPKKKAAAKKPAFDDDDEDEDAPLPKKAAKKPAVTDDDDEDDIPVKKPVPPSSAPSKKAAAPKKRTVMDELDDMDE